LNLGDFRKGRYSEPEVPLERNGDRLYDSSRNPLVLVAWAIWEAVKPQNRGAEREEFGYKKAGFSFPASGSRQNTSYRELTRAVPCARVGPGTKMAVAWNPEQ
jgi:hypothetical protein